MTLSTEFVRRGREWKLTVDLEAPAKTQESGWTYMAERQTLQSRAADSTVNVVLPGGAGHGRVDDASFKLGFRHVALNGA